MSSEKLIPLSEFVTLQRGFDLPQNDRRKGNVPIIASNGVIGTHSEPKVKAPGVVIGRSGSIGGGQFVREDFWPLNTTLYVKDFKNHHPRFVYFLMRSINFSKFNVGSGVPTLNRNHLVSVEVRSLGFEVEAKVAKFLGDLDDKIELNRQTNQTLEQIAQALFKSWFVDFEPTRAKIAAKEAGASPEEIERAAMCAISCKTPDQLAQNHLETQQNLKTTAALFPDVLVDSELGEVPEGWEVKSLSAIIEIIGGGTPKRSEEAYWNGDVPWFSVRDVPASGDIFVVDTEEKISELGLQKSSTKLLPVGTTIISARGTVGKLALVATPMCMNQSCYGIRGKDGFGSYFTYFNLREAVDTLLRNVHGAVFDTITTQTFESYSMAVSAEDLTKQFDASVEPLLKRIELNVRENITLSKIRDSLLPKLLSGEIELN